MAIYTKESLETLKQRIDLVEVLRSYIDLKPAGAAYKALCPFHDEKTPSFVVQRGDRHYHCFGCQAHGDAIQFLMTFQKFSFSEAVENLAEKFQVLLEKVDVIHEPQGPSRGSIKEALELACEAYHFCLLHTAEGHEALRYLYGRGIDLAFIQHFRLGLAPKQQGTLRPIMKSKNISEEVLLAAGLLSEKNKRDFFSDRITFPIQDASGSVIGFSARKYKEETYGGKYVNTPETILFKKSRVLFGLNFSRRRIAKDRKVVIVEGQLDALRLIYEGLNITVAGQGTAFGEGHVQELVNLGINQVFLALDSDSAGQEAAVKIGNLFQKNGIEVKVVSLPAGHDPDSLVREQKIAKFISLLEDSSDYLSFLVNHRSKFLNVGSPAGKSELVHSILKQIREWPNQLMIHESIRKLASLLNVPEEMISSEQAFIPNLHIKRFSSIGTQKIDPDRVLEADFLRWLLMVGEPKPAWIELAKKNVTPEQLHNKLCREVYQTFLSHVENKKSTDFLSLVVDVEQGEAQELMAELFQKKINRDRGEQQFLETIRKILERNWMQEREEIRRKIQSGQCSDEEVEQLMQQFNLLTRNPPALS